MRVRSRAGATAGWGIPGPEEPLHPHTCTHAKVTCADVGLCTDTWVATHAHNTCGYMHTHVHTSRPHTGTYTPALTLAQVCTCTHRQTSVSPVRKGPLGPSADKEGCAGPPRPEQLLGEPPYCLHPGTHMPTLEQMLQALFPGPVLLGSGKSLEPCFSDMLLGTSGKPGGARDRQGVRARQAGCSWRGHSCGPCFLWTAADGAPPEMLPQLLDTALPAPSSVEWCPTLP